jgi:hypothetical protein
MGSKPDGGATLFSTTRLAGKAGPDRPARVSAWRGFFALAAGTHFVENYYLRMQ